MNGIKNWFENLELKYKIIILVIFVVVAFILTKFVFNQKAKDYLDTVNYNNFNVQEELSMYTLYNERNTYYVLNNIINNLFSTSYTEYGENGYTLDDYYNDALSKKYKKSISKKEFKSLVQNIYSGLVQSDTNEEVGIDGSEGVTQNDSDFYTIDVYKKSNYYIVKYTSKFNDNSGYICLYLNDDEERFTIFYIE